MPTVRGPPPPPRSVPDDSLFRASLHRLNDDQATDVDRRFAALAPLPTPVASELCTRMRIPAGKLTTEHNVSEIMASLDSDSQPELWREAKPHLRDFMRISHQGISFVCTSDHALQRLGGVQLTICDTPATIRKYSSYDKLYYVDLQRLPADVSDPLIYDWFVARGARPILITPTQVLGELKSRARTVGNDGVNAARVSTANLSSAPVRMSTSLTPTGNSAAPATMGVSTHEKSDHAHTLPMPTPMSRQPSVSSLGSVTIDEPEWKLVQHSQYGVLDRDGGSTSSRQDPFRARRLLTPQTPIHSPTPFQ
ncbi:unnamed protein product [Phytophthora lilii]|uniref:Unnamed protein product n=1 Tax=Phytophthora lilii TaxID=2077276 RepID=A0A9W6YLA9_9STRA|nr:unnamed protein product [Phytophthora lilii]